MNAEKLKAIAQPMNGEEKARMNFRRENAEWLRMSATIALKIRKILRKQEISQTELAVRLGVSPAQVSKLLSGKVNFELKTICKIQSILDEDIIEVNLSSKKQEAEKTVKTPIQYYYVMSEPIISKVSEEDETNYTSYRLLG